MWGDSSMWYLIADANGLASGSTLTAGQVLTIPNKVTNIHNNAGTFRPYNPGEAIGDLNPTIPAMPQPPRRKRGCGGLGAIIAAIVAVAVTFVTAGAGAPAILAAAAGNVAGQLTGMALGVQNGFNFGSFATSVITAGIGELGPVKTLTSNIGNAAGSVFGGALGNFANIATQAAVGNVISQGVGILTGQQKGFSWSSVAISAIAAPIVSSVNDSLFGKIDTATGLRTSNFALSSPRTAGALAGFVSSGVTELTRVAIQGGKINWVSVATGTAQGVADVMRAQQITADRLKQGNTTAVNGNAAPGINLNDVTGAGIQFSQEQRALAFASTEDIMKTPAQRGGLNVNYFDNGLTSQDDLAAIQAGGLRVRSYGDVKDVPPAQGIKVIENAKALNGGNAAIKASSGLPIMFDTNSSFYYLNVNQYLNSNAPSNMLINPKTGLKEMQYTKAVRDAEKANKLANSPRIQYSDNNYVMRDGDKNPSMTLEQQGKKFEQDVGMAIYGPQAVAVVAVVAPGIASRAAVNVFTRAGVINAGIGMTVNGTFQATNDKPFSGTDFIMSGVTSAATTNASLLSSLYINASGALLSAQITGDAQAPKTVGASAGSVVGSGVSGGLDFISSSNLFGKYSPMVNKAIKNVTPVASSAVQERVGNIVEDKFSN